MINSVANIQVNPNLTFAQCKTMVNRIKTVKDCTIAMLWLQENLHLTPMQFKECMNILTEKGRKAISLGRIY